MTRAAFDFSGSVILVTGGANGIGAALSVELRRRQATVVVADVDEEGARALAAEGGGPGCCEAVRMDVSRRDEVQRTVADVVERHGRLDGLVCAAVVQPLARIDEISPEEWQRVIDVNLNGVVWCCQAVLPTMKRQAGGSIVLFASGTADTGKPLAGGYTASKGAVRSFAKTLAREVADARVRVNVFRPGAIDTPQFRTANPGGTTIPLDRPQDAVGPLMFLLSEAATMTGSLVAREMPFPGAG
ncbi:MAG: SDR family NAD(P)-dependent oxidoreductase [Solirubrobacterales bacterium]|nr:SDR family NAD(P)-dependent oxidoreductase [Solirubrobacterales bacterium]